MMLEYFRDYMTLMQGLDKLNEGSSIPVRVFEGSASSTMAPLPPVSIFQDPQAGEETNSTEQPKVGMKWLSSEFFNYFWGSSLLDKPFGKAIMESSINEALAM